MSRCCSISKDTNFSANHNLTQQDTYYFQVLFNKQRYEFFSKSQHTGYRQGKSRWCCSISKDTNFSANHNIRVRWPVALPVLFNKQRYEFFSKSQLHLGRVDALVGCCSISKDTNFSANHNIRPLWVLTKFGCCSISKDTNFSANHNGKTVSTLTAIGVVQ